MLFYSIDVKITSCLGLANWINSIHDSKMILKIKCNAPWVITLFNLVIGLSYYIRSLSVMHKLKVDSRAISSSKTWNRYLDNMTKLNDNKGYK